MKMTKHAHARFKQRQKIKNKDEMMRRFALAVERGTLLEGGSSKPGTLCYVFDGCKYIVSDDKRYLITVFPAKKRSMAKKNRLVEEMRMRQYALEARMCLSEI